MKVHGVEFSDHDVVNPDDYDAYKDNRVWVFHDHGSVLGVVIMPDMSDAFDELADSGKIDHLIVSDEEMGDYELDEEGRLEDERVGHLGNAGEPFDVESVGVYELAEPKFSLTALLERQERDGG